MPKPTRRERRMLAEKGKLQPRRAAPSAAMPRTDIAPSPQAARPVMRKTVARADDDSPMMSEATEYNYVKSDLARIAVLASALVAVMVALKFVLPQ